MSVKTLTSRLGRGGSLSLAEDTLQGVAFSFRLQALRSRSGTSLVGLYKDTACTVPATTAGDSIAAWRDELSGSGLIALQATAGKQPTLQFVNGLPVVRFDGVDDTMDIATTVAQPAAIYVVGASNDADFGEFIDGSASGARMQIGATSSGGQIQWYSGNVALSPGNFSGFNYITGVFNGAASAGWVNGVSQFSGVDVGSMSLNPRLGGDFGGFNPGGFLTGDIAAVFMHTGTPSATARGRIESYLARLKP